MNQETIISELRAANPLGSRRLASLDLDAAEAALGAELFTESAAGESGMPDSDARPEPRRPRSVLLALAPVAAVAAVVAILLLAGGAESPTRAYGAKAAHLADGTPLLLLEGPGWRVRSTRELGDGEGATEFVTEEPTSAPARQRTVKLAWYDARLSRLLKLSFNDWVPGRELTATVPALGTMVYVDTTAGISSGRGGPGERKMVAVWREDGHLLELRTAVPDLAAFRERLGWLRRVDAQTWFGATRPRSSRQ